MSKKYVILCNEKTDFGVWSIEEPVTRQELIETFYSLGQNEGIKMKKRHYSIRSISDVWNVTIKSHKEFLKDEMS